jgi:hypothetical protein
MAYLQLIENLGRRFFGSCDCPVWLVLLIEVVIFFTLALRIKPFIRALPFGICSTPPQVAQGCTPFLFRLWFFFIVWCCCILGKLVGSVVAFNACMSRNPTTLKLDVQPGYFFSSSYDCRSPCLPRAGSVMLNSIQRCL